MPHRTGIESCIAHLVDLRAAETLDVLGPSVQFLTEPSRSDESPCVMRGAIPPGMVVPLHSHPDPETFILVSGAMEGLAQGDEGHRWIGIQTGGIFHVPSGAKHAFRNPGDQPAVALIVTTSRLGRFFRDIGTPEGSAAKPPTPPSAEAIQHFLATAQRYGYWNATPEENAKIGIALPPAG
jgi:quercetin dioxygenase-like cupin family protein